MQAQINTSNRLSGKTSRLFLVSNLNSGNVSRLLIETRRSYNQAFLRIKGVVSLSYQIKKK